jgi:hypothetical protein
MGRQETVVACDNFDNPPLLDIRFGTGAIGAIEPHRVCGTHSIKMMRLLAAPDPHFGTIVDGAELFFKHILRRQMDRQTNGQTFSILMSVCKSVLFSCMEKHEFSIFISDCDIQGGGG